MPKRTAETKVEKQTVKKQPTELKDDQLDEVQGGTLGTLRKDSDGQSGGPKNASDDRFNGKYLIHGATHRF